jgi:hypothetical protein
MNYLTVSCDVQEGDSSSHIHAKPRAASTEISSRKNAGFLCLMSKRVKLCGHSWPRKKFIAIGAKNAIQGGLGLKGSANIDDLSKPNVQGIISMFQRPEPDTHRLKEIRKTSTEVCNDLWSDK